jgi:hypothetical protein
MTFLIQILRTILFSILATIILFSIKNRSNISSFIAIPLLASLLTKYILGDWDKGFSWTNLDIVYWLTIISTSYCVVYLLSNEL